MKRIKLLYYEQNKTRLKQLGIGVNEAAEYLLSVDYNAVPVSPTSETIVDWVAKPRAD